MAKYRLAQCDIRTAEDNFQEAITAYNEATTLVMDSVEKLVKMLNHLDNSLLKLKDYMQYTFIDGEDVTIYYIHSAKVMNGKEVFVVANNEYDENEEIHISELSYEEMLCLGKMLYKQFKDKYGKMTHKEMVEIANKK